MIMNKKFNVTGICRPAKHYMADISHKLGDTLDMVNEGLYFIINRPRQYGKTTMLYTIERVLMQQGDYFVFNISFEGIGDAIFEDEKDFAPGFLHLLVHQAGDFDADFAKIIKEKIAEVDSLRSLSLALTEILQKVAKPVVLLIDEVDKSSNNQLFVSFLAMLRAKYLDQDRAKTFHSIVLAGVHDVKTLKLKIRPDSEQKYNSPWNIASEYKVDLNLNPHEIKPMLAEYCADRGVKMDIDAIAERLFYHTSGYPFLVSRLCKMVDEDFLPTKTIKEWTEEDIDKAVREVVKESNTNFDSLVKNLENNPELYQLVYRIAIDNDPFPFSIHDPTINLGVLYGIFVKNGNLKIHNRIYNEVLLTYMTVGMLMKQSISQMEAGRGYKNRDGRLNMESVLQGFQAFMKKEYSRKDRNFLEKNGRLVFLAFLKPIINGNGFDIKETQISEEKRLDVVITYLNEKFIAELKLWRGESYHEQGLEQLSDYLDRQGLKEGYLVIFDHSEVKNWQSEWLEVGDKKVFVIWV
jgi:hypothetical protein